MSGEVGHTGGQEAEVEGQEDPCQEALACLDDRERHALGYLERSRAAGGGYAPLSSDFSQRLFQLFLRGLTTEDIRILNPGCQLSQIVECRVVGEWDRRRATYDLQLVTDGADAVKRAQLETALLASDMLAASARINRERIHRYFLTGDQRELGDLTITSIRALKETLDVLMTATRQNQPQGISRPDDDPAAGAPPVLVGLPASRSLVEMAAEKRQARLALMEAARTRRRRRV